MKLNRVISILPGQLDDYICNEAKLGDVLVSYRREVDSLYWYFCNEDNIGKDVKPFWLPDKTASRLLLENRFKDMTLEEKVDFLINEYIESKF